ncbi:MAG: hypothetical protein M3Z66_08855 [Chloroflexota bacterium]|nr:hypothetical protein [Chloroflexota bacterium]
MSTSEIFLVVSLAVLVIGTQLGKRRVTWHRFLLPFAGVGYAAFYFLRSIPTAGGDLDFELICVAAGLGLGALSALMVRVYRDPTTGRVMARAGAAYAAIWIAVFGGRLAFALAAAHIWGRQVMEFSIQHAITGAAAWTAAFILMALAMVVARSVVMGGKVLLATRRQAQVGRLARVDNPI